MCIKDTSDTCNTLLHWIIAINNNKTKVSIDVIWEGDILCPLYQP